MHIGPGKRVNSFLYGAAWKGCAMANENEQMLETVRAVSKLGMEVCVTLDNSATPKRKS